MNTPLFGAQIEISLKKLSNQLLANQTKIFVWDEDCDEAFILDEKQLKIPFYASKSLLKNLCAFDW